MKKTKKDFDKEKMYSKIMPSIVTPPGEPEPEPAGKQPDEWENPGGQQFVLRNFLEDLVLSKLDHTIKMLRGCECELCKKDVMALALNELPSAYSTIRPQDLEATLKTLRTHYEVKVASALIKSVQAVKANARH